MASSGPPAFVRLTRRILAGLVARAPAGDGAASRSEGAQFPVENFSWLERLQREGPVHAVPAQDGWLVVGYGAVEAVLADSASFSSRPQLPIDSVLLGADPPRHASVRRFLAGYFTAEALAPIVAGAEGVATDLIRAEFDAVGDYALPLTNWAGAALLGLDADSFGRVKRATQARHGGLPFAEPIDLDAELRRATLHERIVRDAGGLLDGSDASSLLALLATASTETAERLIARAILILLQHDDVRRALAGESGLLPAFVEEVLRLFPPEPVLLREAVRSATVCGVEIPAGAQLRLSVAAANRDPCHFEEPHALRLDRPKRHHFAFGGGIHQCIGAGLGRRLAFVALQTLLRRAPGLAPAEPLESLAYDDIGGRLLPRRLLIRS
jgi:cytochrome P450